MKTNIEQSKQPDTRANLIILVDADADSVGVVLEATAGTDYRVRLEQTSRKAFALLTSEFHKVHVVIVDVDPGAHGLALLEAISSCADRPAMVVISALEETYMQSIAKKHGAAACLGKPIASETLKATLKHVSANRSLSCDHWGRLIPGPVDKHLDVERSFSGIKAKLSPGVTKIHEIC